MVFLARPGTNEEVDDEVWKWVESAVNGEPCGAYVPSSSSHTLYPAFTCYISLSWQGSYADGEADDISVADPEPGVGNRLCDSY